MSLYNSTLCDPKMKLTLLSCIIIFSFTVFALFEKYMIRFQVSDYLVT